jgi:hypothetical protein
MAALAQAEQLKQAGRLDDYAILDALRANRLVSAKAILAVGAGLTVPIVERACMLRSARAIVSLAWRAGFSAQTAVVLQTMLAGLAPDQVLQPDNKAPFPLSNEEMQWQLAFLSEAETEPRPWIPRRL